MEISPAGVLAIWASGVGAGLAVVAWWRVVGPGYAWMAGAVAMLLGLPAALASGSVAAWIGCVLFVVSVALARRPSLVAGSAALGSVAFLVAAAFETGLPGSLSGMIFLGGVTSDMMLSHWYLVDPRLPRWALRRLATAGGVGAAVDGVSLVAFGALSWGPGDAVVGIGFLILLVATIVLMLGVVASLKEPGYPGVMAATGLSYLALLTGLGAAIVGRMLVAGPVLG